MKKLSFFIFFIMAESTERELYGDLRAIYRLTEIQISSIFWIKLHRYNSVKETGTSHKVKISCQE
jgi:hypothetical protein